MSNERHEFEQVKAIAHLRGGGTVDIALPLSEVSLDGYTDTLWREDANGVMLNMEHIQAITFAPVEKRLVALVDTSGDRWILGEYGQFRMVGKTTAIVYSTPWERRQIEEAYGPVTEEWR